MSKICYVMIGVSGSGKTTAIKNLSKLHPNKKVSIFSLDTCRINLLDSFLKNDGIEQYTNSDVSESEFYTAAYNWADTNPTQFNELVNDEWVKSLQESTVLFIDNMNLSKKSRARWISEAKHKGFQVVAVEMHTPLVICQERQSTRTDKSLPIELISEMYLKMQSVKVPEEVDYIIHVDGITGEMMTSESTIFV